MLEQGSSMIEYILGNMNLNEFQEGPSRELAELLLNLYQEFEEPPLDAIKRGQFMTSESVRQLVASLSIRQHHVSEKWKDRKIEVPEQDDDARKVAEDCMRIIKRAVIKHEMEELENQILGSDAGSRVQLELQEQYHQRIQFLRAIEKRGVFDS